MPPRWPQAIAAQLHDLGPVHQALAGEGDQVGLGSPPAHQRHGPLLGAAQVRYLLAGVDHGAIDIAGDRRPDFAGHDRHHRLVKQGQTLAHPALLHQGPSLEVQRQSQQVSVAEPSADPGSPSSRSLRGRVITHRRRLDRDRKRQQTVLGAILLLELQQLIRAGEPTAGLRKIPLEQQGEGHPEHAPRGPPGITGFDIGMMGTLQRLPTLLHVAEEIGRGRQQLKVLPHQEARLVSPRERGVGLRPREPPTSIAAPRELIASTHRALASQPTPDPCQASAPRKRPSPTSAAATGGPAGHNVGSSSMSGQPLRREDADPRLSVRLTYLALAGLDLRVPR